jgi:hypothetical protein
VREKKMSLKTERYMHREREVRKSLINVRERERNRDQIRNLNIEKK